MPQESIIDSIKKNVIFKKVFKSKTNKFNFESLRRIANKIFNTNLSEDMFDEEFEYSFIDKNIHKQTVKYKVVDYDEDKKIIKISRESKEGKYITTLEIHKEKIYYFEAVHLEQPPFGVNGHFEKILFKHHFKKRIKLIKKELDHE